MEHTCIKDDGGTPNRKCAACEQEAAAKRKYTFNREPKPIPKAQLVKDAYYVGVCRNACIARWDGEKFHHWRQKFGSVFVETIKHREDDQVFDVFDAWHRIDGNPLAQVKEIPYVIG